MKQLRLMAAALVTAIPAIVSAGAQQVGEGNAVHGKTLYRETGCYQCHGLAGQGALMTGPRLSRTELPLDAFVNQLRHPVNQMPPYEAAIVSDRDAADIHAYLRQMPAPPEANNIPLLKVGR